MTYEPTGLALEIFQSRHAAHERETWLEACHRVAQHVANAEQGEARNLWKDRFQEVLHQNLLMPGGRIWYGSGKARGQLLNCVDGDTLVHTRSGLVKACDLAGKTVDTLSQGGVYRPAKWASYGTQELCLVEFENGDTVLATPGHQWVVTKEKGGDERVVTAALEGRLVPMQHVSPSERTLDPASYRTGIQHGLVYGDGTVNHTGKAHLLQFGDSRHLVEDYFDKHTVQYHARYPEGVTYVGALPAIWKTRMPAVETHGTSYVFGFIAGYIAADGNVDNRGTVTLHGSKKEDLEQIRILAAEVGLPTVSLKIVRELNPWNGEPAPLWCLRFSKTGIDARLILKNKHREYLAGASITAKRTTMRVVRVTSTGRQEEVYCCDEPETHTWVAGMGYLTGNCFVIPSGDSREAWGKSVSDSIIISGTGGGVGVNCSPVRPRGTPIRGTGGTATGSVSLMSIINAAGEEIKAGGGRRTALMLALSISHGDIVEFLDKKLDLKELNNANVSVVFDENPEVFFVYVKEDKDWPLLHQGKEVGRIPARVLWERTFERLLGQQDVEHRVHRATYLHESVW
jgi:ribonucleoside-diphosphate reductase alpha chain